MFRRAKDFYSRALVMAEKLGAKDEALKELQFYETLMEKHDGTELEALTELEDGTVTLQRKRIEAELEEKIRELNEKQYLPYSLKELDFRLQQELTSLGWILSERDGRVEIYTYLPTAHM